MNVQVEKKWLIGGGIAAVVLIVFAIAAWQDKSIDIPVVGSNGHVSYSDGTLCSTWEAGNASYDAQNAYLDGKLNVSDAQANERGSVYWSGMLVNCWDARTIGEAFARTDEIVTASGLQGAEQEFQFSLASGIAP